MPVTVSYSFTKLGDLYPQPLAMSAAPDAATLSDGSIIIAGSDTPTSAVSILNTDGIETLALSALPFARPAVTALADGGFAVAGFSAGHLVISGYNAAGAGTFSSTRVDPSTLRNADIVQLTGGNIVTVYQADYHEPSQDFDILMDIRSANGAGDTLIGIATDQASDTAPCAAALANGNVAVAWTHWNAGTSSSEVMFAIYDSAGKVLSPRLIANRMGTVNTDVSIAATSNGFVLAYTTNELNAASTDIGLTAFGMNGEYRGHTLIDNGGLNDSHASLSTVSGNLLALTRTVFNTDNDVYVSLVDGVTLESYVTRNLTPLPFQYTQQDFATVTMGGLGHLAVFWQDISLMSDEINGQLLQVTRTAEGTAGDDTIAGDGMHDNLTGGVGDDVLSGGANGDDLNGQEGDDTLAGGSGMDVLWGGAGADILSGGTGNDYLDGGAGADILAGGSGIDVLSYGGSAAAVKVNLQTGAASGGDAQGDIFSGFETLVGSYYGDTLVGNAAANRIFGGNGADRMAGAAGRDTFVFETLLESQAAAPDVITDFTLNPAADGRSVDRIDLHFIDASAAGAGHEAFTFIGSAGFSAEGQIRCWQSGLTTVVEVNTIGAGGAEMSILLRNVTASELTVFDFVL